MEKKLILAAKRLRIAWKFMTHADSCVRSIGVMSQRHALEAAGMETPSTDAHMKKGTLGHYVNCAEKDFGAMAADVRHVRHKDGENC